VTHPFARLDGIGIMFTLLLGSGDLCPACGYATRPTSKRWARCKQCGKSRIPRREMSRGAQEMKGGGK
jgi:hypothetical protein